MTTTQDEQVQLTTFAAMYAQAFGFWIQTNKTKEFDSWVEEYFKDFQKQFPEPVNPLVLEAIRLAKFSVTNGRMESAEEAEATV